MSYFRLKDIDVKKYVGNRVNLIFIAKNINIRPQKNGGEYMSLTMVDRDKAIEAKIFSITDEVKSKVVEGLVYEAIVEVQDYVKNDKHTISCVIANENIQQSGIHPSALADWVENLQDYSNALGEAIKLTDGTIYGEITREILTKYWDKFAVWPAAINQHHTQLGGLLFHTSTVVEAAISIAKFYNKIYGERFINIPLLVAGAILHDIMKVKEIDADINSGIADYSEAAALTTHVMDIISEIDIVAVKRGIENTEEVRLLKHVVAAHHGKLEYGSPIKPSCPEAFILNMIDDIDAEMWKYNKEFKELQPGKYNSTWVNGSSLVVRYKETSKKDPIVI